MARILLADDDLETQQLVQQALGNQFELFWAKSAAETKAMLNQKPFNLLILDVSLPDGDGFQLCAYARAVSETRNVPIIFLTGRTGIENVTTGFTLGADDYIVKPFNPLELNLRIKARINRSGADMENSKILVKGKVSLDLLQQRATLTDRAGHVEIDLQNLDFKLLVYFMQNEDRVVSRQQLLDAAWGTSTFVIDRTVDKHIHSLRQRLGPCAGYIQTIPSAGYRFSTRKIS